MIVRPAPLPGVYEDQFWQYVAERELRLQRCENCGAYRYPPGPACPQCLSEGGTWTPVAGRGRVLSWTVFHKQYFDAMPPPHTVVAVEADEGPIMITDLNGPSADLRMGAPVELTYQEATTDDGRTFMLYQWRLLTDDGGR